MKSRRIVFFGGLGNSKQFGGEPSKNKELVRRLRELGYKLVIIDSLGSRKRKLRLMKILIYLFWNILVHPRAIFLFSTSYGNISGIIKLLYYYPVRLNIVYWVIGGLFADRVCQNYFNSKYLNLINCFIVEGDKMKHLLNKCGFSNVFVKPNFKEINILQPVEKYNDGKIHFYFLSRIRPEKGANLILNSVKNLNSKGYKDKFLVDFYGDIEIDYEEDFKNALGKMNNVRYCGTLQLQIWNNYEQLAKYHYMLFPTYWIGEGFPGVVIDAFIAGTPIIASDWNLNQEFIEDGMTGFIVPANNETALSRKMMDVIEGKYDYDFMVRNCQSTSRNFDVNSVVTGEFAKQIFA